MNLEQLDSSIKNSKSILIISHINPDGDTLGSMCALNLLIKDNYKKKSDMLVVSKIPETYEFLPEIKNSIHIENFNFSREYDLVIFADVASIDRSADAASIIDKVKYSINIDHHETNNNYADLNIVNPSASATGEVICEMAENMNWKISSDCAKCLYTAILTDTGGFKFSNTKPQTLKYASSLISLGANPNDIYQKCYESYSKNMVLFQSYCVGKAIFSDNDKIAYTIVYKKDLEKFHNNGEDFTDGLTEKLRAINTTEVAFVIKELNPATSKVSMRSKNINVAEICSKFGGGGHKLAAGSVIKAKPGKASEMILEQIRKQVQC